LTACVETALRQADRNGNRARARESRRKIARMPIIKIDNERDLGPPTPLRPPAAYPKEASSNA